ncbi:hypothetical protein JW905_00895 [bacterium]|nr:hypothetical protein [candidate division CSSED10-310 bacterium]
MQIEDRDYLHAAAHLRQEADRLLQHTALLTLLAGYGTVHLTGSYCYDLMTWRDIDLCVATNDLSTPAMFELGRAMAALPHVGSMYYRNELVMQTKGNPLAVFWCVDFYLPDAIDWKVDILLASPEEVQRVLTPGQELMSRITPAAREAILRIKGELGGRPGYRREFGSRAVYRAVIEDQVATLEEWEDWWARYKAANRR